MFIISQKEFLSENFQNKKVQPSLTEISYEAG